MAYDGDYYHQEQSISKDQQGVKRLSGGKRDRPISGYFESPTGKLSTRLLDFFNLEGRKGIDGLQIGDETEYETEGEDSGRGSFRVSREEQDGDDTVIDVTEDTDVEIDFEDRSPLLNSRALRNITNFVTNFDLPNMKKKLVNKRHNILHSIDHFVSESLKSQDDFVMPSLGEDDGVSQHSPEQCDEQNSRFSYSEMVTGSPLQNRNRRGKDLRRFHSMVQTSKEKESYIMGDNSYLSKSPIKYFKVENDLLPRIDEDELHKILLGAYENAFDEYLIVDCRFDYEYNGGHIKNAVNVSTQKDLEEFFINNEANLTSDRKQLLIFHCEFSIFRGPNMASFLRKRDRLLNKDNYPILSYPDIVILEGGYRKFYEKYRASCYPQAYVEMRDVHHQERCELEMGRIRHSFKSGLSKSNPRDSLLKSHTRSHSFTIVTSHAANLKILKRQRSTSKAIEMASEKRYSKEELDIYENGTEMDECLKSTSATTLSYNPSSVISPVPSPTILGNGLLDEVFFPPSTSFRTGGKKINNTRFSNSSFNSSCSSISSDQGYPFSSTDSLTDSCLSSPNKASEHDKLHRTPFASSTSENCLPYMSSTRPTLLTPLANKPKGALPALPNQRNMGSCLSSSVLNGSQNQSFLDFTFPKPMHKCRESFNRSHIKHSKIPNLSSTNSTSTICSIISDSTSAPYSDFSSSSIIDPPNTEFQDLSSFSKPSIDRPLRQTKSLQSFGSTLRNRDKNLKDYY